jgi:hypothetical protein
MKVNSNLAVLFWLRGRQAKADYKELYARLTIDGLRAEVSLGIKIDPASWDQEAGHLTDNSAQFNAYLKAG